MIQKLFKPFTEWGTRLKADSLGDSIDRARLLTALLFLGLATLSFFVVGALVDAATREILHTALLNPSSADGATIAAQIEHVRWLARVFHLFLFAVGTYLLMGLSLRPVRRSIELQKRFIANISHELRTPLTVTKTETEIALRSKDTLTLEQATSVLEGNLSRVDHMSRIIQFLLVLSDFNASKSSSLRGTADLLHVMEKVYEHSVSQSSAKGVTLVLDVLEPATKVKGNPVALEKMLLNLVRNAIVHTPQGGKVTIGLRLKNRKALLSVSDTGGGIPESDLPHVFEPFYRGGNAAKGGSGLGLSIVREVVRLHGASIEVESKEGGGSTFVVTLKA